MKELDESVRRKVLDVALLMAWADARIDRSELMAISGVAKALELSIPENELYELIDRGTMPIEKMELGELGEEGTKLAFLTAAWIAQVDESSEDAEAARLQALQLELGIAPERAGELSELAQSVHARFDRSRAWWEEYQALLAS